MTTFAANLKISYHRKKRQTLDDYLMLEDSFSKIVVPKETYTTPTCKVVEIAPMEMLAVSGEGSDTDGDHNFGERGEDGFQSTRRRGEWGNLWVD